MIRIETKNEIGIFFEKLKFYLEKNKIFKNHYINISDFDENNPRIWGMAISIFPKGTKDNLFLQNDGNNLFIYNMQFWKEWHRTKRIIIFALWAGDNVEKSEEFRNLKEEWSNNTKSELTYNAGNTGGYVDLSKRKIPPELKNMPKEIDENVIFPIIENTLEKLYIDYNDHFKELFNITKKIKKMTIIDYYRNWIQTNGVSGTYNGYANDLQDIRDGLLAKSIPNVSVNKVFTNPDIQARIKAEELNIDIFDICKNIVNLISKLQNYHSVFLKIRPSCVIIGQPNNNLIYDYSKKSIPDKSNSGQPEATLNKYIKFLEFLSRINSNIAKEDERREILNSLCGTTPSKEEFEQEKTTKEIKHLNQILFGPPGTGKTYHTIDKSVQIIDEDYYEKNKDVFGLTNEEKKQKRNNLKIRFKELKENGQIVFTTFHQSMSYEEFVEGLKPYEKNGEIFYEVKKGIFRQICIKAEENSAENYVLIIDEINRGNIASIFGELITLIEPDKRKNADEELFVKLPYSKKEFTVPQNLHIIGTMNTADRSVEALDSALRRRFIFEEMPPNENLLNADFHSINLQEVLKHINVRIEKLIDKDHKIGHSYFMKLSSIKNLQNAFKNKLIPLLEEYFYGDFVKIGLILGDNFMQTESKNENIFKTIDTEEDYTDFENRIIYNIVVPQDETEFINAVKNIYL